MKGLLLTALLFSLSSCGSYIKQMHSDFDRADGRTAKASKRSKPIDDQFDFIRQRRMAGMPKTSRNTPVVMPSQKRVYNKAQAAPKKRYKVDDLTDNGPAASLWGANKSSSYLFSVDTIINSGDIVVINVQADLKNEITRELVRSFPRAQPKRRKKKKNDKAKTADNPAPASVKADADPEAQEVSSNKVYDRVSSIVMEEINDDHILVKGRKYLLFRGKRRVVEVQALVGRVDINDSKSVNSDKLLEKTIRVVR
ncbi:MAG: flagellar basal body L-ring protein FlgH [Bacteriovoracaceae bacterium]